MINDLGIVFLAAGNSSRYGKENKLLEIYKGLPVFIHSINTLASLCSSHVIVCEKNEILNFRSLLKQYIPDKEFIFAIGGKERFNSVYNGLEIIKRKTKYTAIHDTARPLVTEYILNKCYESCKTLGSGIAAKRITDTIKRTNKENEVTETIDRTDLWAIETPQTFITDEIYEAYTKIIKDRVFITDDSSAMEYIGKKVYLVENPYPNKKITYKSDLNELDVHDK